MNCGSFVRKTDIAQKQQLSIFNEKCDDDLCKSRFSITDTTYFVISFNITRRQRKRDGKKCQNHHNPAKVVKPDAKQSEFY